MSNVNEILEYLENNLDAGHIGDLKKKLKATLNYEVVEKVPFKLNGGTSTFSGFPYVESVEDMEKMMVNELLVACYIAENKTDGLPMIRANYGVGIMPSLFGLNCRIVNDSMPWVDHLSSVDDVKRLVDKGIPNLETGLGKKVLDAHEFYNEKLSHFEKCKKFIPVYHPDLQGPFDIAHLIWGGDIYYGIYDEPELLHDLLKLVTETYISYMKKAKKTINDTEDGFNFHWGTLYKGNIVLRDDSPVNLSKDMYNEFVKPYDEKILEEFTDGSIHYCGRADQWVLEMLDTKNLKGLNFGRVPSLSYGTEFLGKVYQKAQEKKIAITDYYIDRPEFEEFIEKGFTTGVTFMA